MAFERNSAKLNLQENSSGLLPKKMRLKEKVRLGVHKIILPKRLDRSFGKARNFICRWMVRQSCSIVQNLVVNHHLVVSYPQQCHIGIHIDYWDVIIIAIHIMLLFCIFWCKTLNNLYKL